MEMRRGSTAAFDAFYRRYSARTLALCRSILGSHDDAEEATQTAFASVWAALQQPDRRPPDALRPWLFTIARHRCLSVLRSRPPAAMELEDATWSESVLELVARRASVEALMSDLGDLPADQRAALVLSELEGLSHAEIAVLLGRPTTGVKSLVFEARKTLGDWREARETPCADVRAKLAILSGGSLRRRSLRRHLEACPSCRDFREQMRRRPAQGHGGTQERATGARGAA